MKSYHYFSQVWVLTEYFPMIIMHAIMMLSTFLVRSSDEEKNGKL